MDHGLSGEEGTSENVAPNPPCCKVTVVTITADLTNLGLLDSKEGDTDIK